MCFVFFHILKLCKKSLTRVHKNEWQYIIICRIISCVWSYLTFYHQYESFEHNSKHTVSNEYLLRVEGGKKKWQLPLYSCSIILAFGYTIRKISELILKSSKAKSKAPFVLPCKSQQCQVNYNTYQEIISWIKSNSIFLKLYM